MSLLTAGTFRSLAYRDYRIWAAGSLTSNVGSFMQRTAQDWLVLTQLTHHDATAVGVVLALQSGPQLLMLPWSGPTVDRVDRRQLLMATQACLGVLALVLGLLTIGGIVRLWHVYLLAGLLGCVSAFDAPTRQVYGPQLVADADLTNAVALNSTSFSLGRVIGPAAAGLMIGAVGTGWVFLINALSFCAVLASLTALPNAAPDGRSGLAPSKGSFLEGVGYVLHRRDLLVVLAMLFLVGTFGINFSIFVSTMAVTVFHAGASAYGAMSSALALGTLCGALFAAGRRSTSLALVSGAAAVFGLFLGVAAAMPNAWSFAAMLTVVGTAALTFTTATTSLLQLAVEPKMRGRVMAIRLAVATGGTPLGAPLIGLIADRFGPRCGLLVGTLAGLLAALVGVVGGCRLRAEPSAPAPSACDP